jgi:DNA-binding transcriptional MerR regulator
MYRIGELAWLSQVPVKTLRYYDQVGLLRPAHVDRATRYRRYGAAQLTQLNRILALKDIGFSLAEIRDHLAQRTPARQLAAALQVKRGELARRIAVEQQRLARATARLELLQREVAALPEIAIRSTAPRLAAAVRDTIATHEECDRLFERLDRAFGRRGGVRGAIFHACAPGAIDCEVFEVLAGAPPPRARPIRSIELPAGRVAVLVYRGDRDYAAAYRDLRSWIAITGLAIAGPKRELYLRSPDEPVTEIQFPIAAEAA